MNNWLIFHDPQLFLIELIVIILSISLHEFGHAIMCRRFGGEVHTMGVMFMVFTPMPYVDATSSWSFRSRWQRVLVGAGGMIPELFVAAGMIFVWANTGEGTLHSLAYNIMFVASVSTLLFNANPLMRFDGYYILSDLLDIPNLYFRSNQQLIYLIERFGFGGKKAESPAHSVREAWWLGVYGLAGHIYRTFVFAVILFFLSSRYLILGVIMAAVCFVSWIIMPVVRLVQYLSTSPRLERNRIRAVAVCAGVVAVVLTFLELIPFPNNFRAPGVLQATEHTIVVKTFGEVWGDWDADRLAQVVANLLGNGVDHGQAARPIEVSVSTDGRYAELFTMQASAYFPELMKTRA